MITRLRSTAAMVDHIGLLSRAFAACPFVSSCVDALEEINKNIARDDVGLFVTERGVVLLEYQSGAFMRGVSVAHIYNSGGHADREELLHAVERFALEHKAPHVWGVDVNQRPRAYERLLRFWNPKRRGILYSYSVPRGAP